MTNFVDDPPPALRAVEERIQVLRHKLANLVRLKRDIKAELKAERKKAREKVTNG